MCESRKNLRRSCTLKVRNNSYYNTDEKNENRIVFREDLEEEIKDIETNSLTSHELFDPEDVSARHMYKLGSLKKTDMISKAQSCHVPKLQSFPTVVIDRIDAKNDIGDLTNMIDQVSIRSNQISTRSSESEDEKKKHLSNTHSKSQRRFLIPSDESGDESDEWMPSDTKAETCEESNSDENNNSSDVEDEEVLPKNVREIGSMRQLRSISLRKRRTNEWETIRDKKKKHEPYEKINSKRQLRSASLRERTKNESGKLNLDYSNNAEKIDSKSPLRSISLRKRSKSESETARDEKMKHLSNTHLKSRRKYSIPSDESDERRASDIKTETDGSYEETNSDESNASDVDVEEVLPKNATSNINCADFHMQTDDFFEAQTGKILTSNNTLKKLAQPHLTKGQLQELLINQDHISKCHKESIQNLVLHNRQSFPMWHFILEQGYNLILHGLGSKKKLISDFHKYVFNHPTLIVNGFFPGLTLKDILENIIKDLMESACPNCPNECVDLISETLKNNPEDRLYLLINNIDGPSLRNDKAQDVLSRLAAIPNLHLIASVDHINAPILWDKIKSSRFNFFWWDATNFLPYEDETSYETSLLIQQKGTLKLTSLKNVFLSLTPNARSTYTILIKYQLDNGNDRNYSGMRFQDLYRLARESFFVSSDVTLRAQLNEFIDHKLVRNKRTADGVERLIIQLDNSILKQFMEDQE